MNKDDILCISLFNSPNTEEERKTIVSMYDTPEIYAFMENFFIKMGIPKECIEIKVWYDETTNAIKIDAQIQQKDDSPITIKHKGESVVVPDGTKFHCLTSQRMDKVALQNCINQSKTSLKIVDQITTSDSPFTLYMISK